MKGIKINGSLLKGLSLAMMVGGFVVDSLLDKQGQSQLKDEVVKECLEKMSKPNK